MMYVSYMFKKYRVNKKFYNITLMLTFVIINLYYSVSTSQSLQNSNLNENATICLSIGLTASLSGLDDFSLEPLTTDGGSFALYKGTEDFNVSSNGGVRIIASGTLLTNRTEQIEAFYTIDGVGNQVSTTPNSVHTANHTLQGIARLGKVSDQLSGQYSGSVTITIMPLYGSNAQQAGCSSANLTYPYESESSWATLAWEDLYPSPGDADYNDMVVQFRTSETFNAAGNLEKINMEFVPVARGAGYNHKLLLNVDGSVDNSNNITKTSSALFNGGADITVSTRNVGSSKTSVKSYSKNDEIILFENTRSSLTGFANVNPGTKLVTPKKVTEVDIVIHNPELNNIKSRKNPGIPGYRPYLKVLNTGKDIDIVDNNSSDNMIDNNGYPFGIVVPINWRWPLEGVNINDVYPYFSEYRQKLNNDDYEISPEGLEWYNYPAENSDGKIFDTELFR